MSNVIVEESPKIKAGRFLRDKDYDLADRVGQRISILNDGLFPELGILRKQAAKKGILAKLVGSETEFLGVLKFYQHEDGVWEFCVHGRDNINELKKLAQEMSEMFGVDVKLKLTSEDKQTERPVGF